MRLVVKFFLQLFIIDKFMMAHRTSDLGKLAMRPGAVANASTFADQYLSFRLASSRLI